MGRNLDNNSTRTLNTTNPNDSQLRSFLHLFRINQDDPAAAFNATKFGTFTANLKPLPSPIPPEYLLAIFGLTVSLIIPSLFRWINGWRQRRNADKCIKKIDPENSEIHDQQGDAEKEIRYSNKDEAEKEIRGLYIKGKISESNLKMLNDMIDTKFKV